MNPQSPDYATSPKVGQKIQKLQARLNPGPGGSSGIGVAASGGVTPRDGSTPRQAPLAAAGGAVGGSGHVRAAAASSPGSQARDLNPAVTPAHPLLRTKAANGMLWDRAWRALA